MQLPNDATLSVVNAFLLLHVLVALAINANVLNNAAASYILFLRSKGNDGSNDDGDDAHGQKKPVALWFVITVCTLLAAFVVSNIITFFGMLEPDRPFSLPRSNANANETPDVDSVS